VVILAIHIHRVDQVKHRNFLRENRSDPFTKKVIIHGDQIIFCAGCKSAFLHSSWQAMGNKHCNQSNTTSDFQSLEEMTTRFGNNVKLQSKIKLLTIVCIVLGLSSCILILFSYNQNQQIKSLEVKSNVSKDSIGSLQNNISESQQILSSLNTKVVENLDDTECKVVEKATEIKEVISIFNKNTNCLLKKNTDYKQKNKDYRVKIDSYKGILGRYPYAFIKGQSIEYKGNINPDNIISNPVSYGIHIPADGKYRFSFTESVKDDDLDVTTLSREVIDSDSNNSGESKNYNLRRGTYSINVWNDKNSKSTPFTIKVTRDK
jgi:hypothetical protein